RRRTLPGDNVNTLAIELGANSGQMVGANTARSFKARVGHWPRANCYLGQDAWATGNCHDIEGARELPKIRHLLGEQVADIDGGRRAGAVWISLGRMQPVRVERRQ